MSKRFSNFWYRFYYKKYGITVNTVGEGYVGNFTIEIKYTPFDREAYEAGIEATNRQQAVIDGVNANTALVALKKTQLKYQV